MSVMTFCFQSYSTIWKMANLSCMSNFFLLIVYASPFHADIISNCGYFFCRLVTYCFEAYSLVDCFLFFSSASSSCGVWFWGFICCTVCPVGWWNIHKSSWCWGRSCWESGAGNTWRWSSESCCHCRFGNSHSPLQLQLFQHWIFAHCPN